MTADNQPTVIGLSTVSLVAEPMRPEYPWRALCPFCGWVDHFDTQSTATLWAWRHDHIEEAAGNQPEAAAEPCDHGITVGAPGSSTEMCLECGECPAVPVAGNQPSVNVAGFGCKRGA